MHVMKFYLRQQTSLLAKLWFIKLFIHTMTAMITVVKVSKSVFKILSQEQAKQTKHFFR